MKYGMFALIKCYKKKTKERGKEYRYNQYVVPLKKSDYFECKDDVVVLPANRLKDLMKNNLMKYNIKWTSKIMSYNMNMKGC
jgi:hypothetical protein